MVKKSFFVLFIFLIIIGCGIIFAACVSSEDTASPDGAGNGKDLSLCVSETSTYYNNGEEEAKDVTKYIYNSSGIKESFIYYGRDGHVSALGPVKCDEYGNEIYSYSPGSFYQETEYDYGENGQIQHKERTIYYFESEYDTYYEDYIYDEEGILTGIDGDAVFLTDGDTSFTVDDFIYDKNGLLLSKTRNNGSAYSYDKIVTEYTYLSLSDYLKSREDREDLHLEGTWVSIEEINSFYEDLGHRILVFDGDTVRMLTAHVYGDSLSDVKEGDSYPYQSDDTTVSWDGDDYDYFLYRDEGKVYLTLGIPDHANGTNIYILKD